MKKFGLFMINSVKMGLGLNILILVCGRIYL